MNDSKFPYIDFNTFSNVYKPILENLNSGAPIDIPGFYGTSGQIIANDIYIGVASGKRFIFTLQEFLDFTADELNTSPQVFLGIKQLFQNCLMANSNSNIINKLDIIRQAESYELFDTTGGFFKNMKQDLLSLYGATEIQANEIQFSMTDLYDNGVSDRLTATALRILESYLGDMIEFVAAKIYMFFKFVNQERLIINPSPMLNYDDSKVNYSSKKGEKYLSFDAGEFANSVNKSASLRVKENALGCLKDTSTVIWDACNELGVAPNEAYDPETNRPVTAVSKYGKFDIPNIGLAIITVLNPVELGRLDFNKYVYSVVDINEPIFNVANVAFSKEGLVNKLKVKSGI